MKQNRRILFAGSFLALFNIGNVSADITLETYYQGGGSGSSGIYSASPDTGFLTVTYNSPGQFVGTVSLTGTAGYGTDVNDHASVTLTTGGSFTLAAGPEGSNQGGFNWSGGISQGLLFEMTGTIDSTPVDYKVYDKDIHSGVFRTNPFGESLDNYVLQGGTKLGLDTGDAFEESQAHGHYSISTSAVPEPSEYAAIFGGMLVALGLARRVRS